VLESVIGQLGYIGRYLVTDNDRESYRTWLRQFLTPILKDVGEEPKTGESDEQKTLRATLFRTLGHDARDPQVLAEAGKVTDKALQNPASVDRELAMTAFGLEALKGDQSFYNKLMSALKTPKSPEEYYMTLFTLPRFDDPQLLQRTLDYAISPDVRSQDALGLIARVMDNPAGQKLAWDFVRQHWPAIEKSGGPFASAEVIGATDSFCDATMRDEVAEFYSAHKIEAAERTYRQSIERINNCVDLKSQQEPQLASWLEHRGSSAGGQ